MQAILREALPLPATPKGVTTHGQRNGLLFMLKGPRLETVSYRTLGSQSKEWPMHAISREALPLPATPKGVTTCGQRNGLLFML